jgi:hypothetical protein
MLYCAIGTPTKLFALQKKHLIYVVNAHLTYFTQITSQFMETNKIAAPLQSN